VKASFPSSRSTLSESARHDQARALSKALFGNQDRIDVVMAITHSEDGVVNATDLAEKTGLINSRVRAQLLALVDAKLLDEVPPTGQDRKRWYVRRDSSFWQACLDLYDKWTESDDVSNKS
jgi:hypothetical protein